jgi:hypothetical protein
VTKALTDESFTDVYRSLSHVAAKGGPYAAIFDFSQVGDFPLSANTIRALASTDTAVPVGRPRVVVASAPALYGLARMFELIRNSMSGQFYVVHELGDAYHLIKVTAEDFTQSLP